MFGHRSFLMLGSAGAADITSLIKGGSEILDCNFSFHQAIDDKGKATSRVYGGTISLSITQLPPQNIIEWALQPRKHEDGLIVILDNENMPLEKIIFKNASCIEMEISYTQRGESYASTKLILQTEKVIVGNGIDFDNEWTQN